MVVENRWRVIKEDPPQTQPTVLSFLYVSLKLLRGLGGYIFTHTHSHTHTQSPLHTNEFRSKSTFVSPVCSLSPAKSA